MLSFIYEIVSRAMKTNKFIKCFFLSFFFLLCMFFRQTLQILSLIPEIYLECNVCIPIRYYCMFVKQSKTFWNAAQIKIYRIFQCHCLSTKVKLAILSNCHSVQFYRIANLFNNINKTTYCLLPQCLRINLIMYKRFRINCHRF